MPRTVTKLGDEAFKDCINLVEVHLSDGLKIIGERAFCECKALRGVAVPSSVAELGNGAFKG
ncbi:hypothetical protein THAOC_20280, partial [Thalassiosira oceanica]